MMIVITMVCEAFYDANYSSRFLPTGFANSPHTIAVGAITADGQRTYYSEECSAMMVVAPSSGAYNQARGFVNQGVQSYKLKSFRTAEYLECTLRRTTNAVMIGAARLALHRSPPASSRSGCKLDQH